MKLNKITIYLFLASLTLLLVGSYIALFPGNYLQQFGVNVGAVQNDFLSELRGMGGGLLVFSLYILISLFRQESRETALILSSLVFSAFVVFRTIGIFIDGVPGQGIFIALSIEVILALGAITLICAKRVTA